MFKYIVQNINDTTKYLNYSNKTGYYWSCDANTAVRFNTKEEAIKETTCYYDEFIIVEIFEKKN